MSKPTIRQNAAREPIYWVVRRDSDKATLCQVGKDIFWCGDWQNPEIYKRYKTLGWATKRVDKLMAQEGGSFTCIAIYDGDSFMPGGFVVRKQWRKDFKVRTSVGGALCIDTPDGPLRVGRQPADGQMRAVHYKQGLASFIKQEQACRQ